jgi:hypothetical protein
VVLWTSLFGPAGTVVRKDIDKWSAVANSAGIKAE